jgi:ABC-type sulfate transport system permease subunit
LSYLLANAYVATAPLTNLAAVSNIGDGVATFFTSILVVLIWLTLTVFVIVAMWKVYVKAGQPGWSSIIPIYNTLIMLRIVGRPWWWLLLLFVPIVNLVIGLIVTYNLAQVFGKGLGFMLGLLFLPFIFYPILAFGTATYLKPVREAVVI